MRHKKPLSADLFNQISAFRSAIKVILKRQEKRRLLIIGPCSLHDVEAALEFAARLKSLSKEVEDQFFIAMRCHVEKPRSSLGWKGMLLDPHLDGSSDIAYGIEHSRQLLLSVAALEIPIAAEFLDPLAALYYEDLVSFGVIGARTALSPLHRHLASSLEMPIGFKNSIDGNLESAVQSLVVAKERHTFLSCGLDGRLCAFESAGNDSLALILRGSGSSTNYDAASIQRAAALLIKHRLNGHVLVDCGHGNSKKCLQAQEAIFELCIHALRHNAPIAGLMLESFLFEGKQPLQYPLSYGVSLTDPCLSFERTKDLIISAATALRTLC
jgi:3-deoxy-7-phosphoheptulonate synthase